MKKCYINGVAAISAQNYREVKFTENNTPLTEFLNYADEPNYKEFLSASSLRRMSKAVKMGLFTAQKALKSSEVSEIEAIITGTGLGCLADSEKFLANLIQNDEEFLTPTAFIQSTHNTVAAQIALHLHCNAYNFTYVNGGNSFEAAALDALLQIKNNEISNALVGGIDEIATRTHQLLQLVEVIQSTKNGSGAKFGEGATFFILSDKFTQKSYAEIVDIEIRNKLENKTIEEFVESFLQENQLMLNDIQVIFVGKNSEVTTTEIDQYFDALPQAIYSYKKFCGEYDTASAYGMLLAAEFLKNQNYPNQSEVENILLYNQFLGKNHSLVLLRKCQNIE
ncbi:MULTISPECIES: beta-ketoacyl synthase N-terminal-like domain-containing protein [Weeksella]|uniref:3-oxoacyl-(Acyl-carrier-protein) synthase n=1 Tax=Weeksella virosa (strain ATCC 43766 / DSM 16922 / JCM 21250 / CCUG 30538 / CDC 9751 / IAM 14551 / NBRC 16016 / NCTC 11634 / CL345/78) TaxID=865938 RepID=F0NZ49_WEEVC|nr:MULTISPECIES: beta-ketoacyl synthase N-terminal-like domain-containing protein [Weeksella]ADX68266.1 3-oxoacyl-(acyl-carrier-protein) synthase [Weeksella virosa DSM 16922]OFM83273.1 hypothetical protein HMPREF2660_01825 [Weeksella sp. HMSC059D05]VEH64097.1 3-oxoacyl-(acyl carrier protein) synthase II [Weeksella virosa]